MDSFNIYKGYGKINHVQGEEQPSPYRHGRRPAIIIAISSLLLLILIGAVIHRSHRNGRMDPIRYACQLTHNPDACFAAISAINSHPKPDPVLILSLSLRSVINEVSKLHSLPNRLMSKVNDRRSVSALQDCGSLLNDAFGSLKKSEAELSKATAAARGLTDMEIGDLRTWISAAMTDQETCVDGLEETGSTVVKEVRAAFQGTNVGMSNTLAILANMDALKRDMMKMCHDHQPGN